MRATSSPMRDVDSIVLLPIPPEGVARLLAGFDLPPGNSHSGIGWCWVRWRRSGETCLRGQDESSHHLPDRACHFPHRDIPNWSGFTAPAPLGRLPSAGGGAR